LIPLDSSEILATAEVVRRYIPAFDYGQLVTDLKKPGALKARFDATMVGYEKVQLFRIMLALNPEVSKGDDVFTKFVNETYHIENEYVMQLNPRDFDAVPEFVIEACTALMDQSAAA